MIIKERNVNNLSRKNRVFNHENSEEIAHAVFKRENFGRPIAGKNVLKRCRSGNPGM